ncbi:MAG: type II toxin-antitoxin system ParD family antitoxin [Alphaproteobacteria bacterium]|nr:type II toxin-antitoxin system ParD family antitoxin [Alphaproteobacteria bacterium]
MPTRNVNLTDEQDAFVEAMVKSGKYQNASEAMRDAVRALQRRWQEDELKLEVLRKLVQDGIDDLDRGRFTEIAIQDLDAALGALAEDDAG